MTKKMMIGAGAAVTALLAARRFGPQLAKRGMRKCQEMFDQQSHLRTDRMNAAATGPREAWQRRAS